MPVALALNLNPTTQSGLTLTAKCYTGTGAAVSVAMSESPASSARYTATATLPASSVYSITFVNAGGNAVGYGSLRTDASGNDVDAILAGIAAGTTGLTLAATQSFNNAGQTTPLPATLYYAGAAVVPIDASTLPAYVAPDNASVAAIKGKTDNLPADPASNTLVNTRMATFAYVAPDNATIGTIGSTLATLAARYTGVTSLAAWLRAMLRSSAPDATALTEINLGGGTYAPATMSITAAAANAAAAKTAADATTASNEALATAVAGLAEAVGDSSASISDADKAAIASGVAGLLNNRQIEYVGPVDPTSDELTLYAGAAYAGANAIRWSRPAYVGNTNNGAATTMRLLRTSTYQRSGSSGLADVEFAGMASLTAGTLTLSFAATAAETQAIDVYAPVDVGPTHQVQVWAGDELLVDAPATVRRRIAPAA